MNTKVEPSNIGLSEGAHLKLKRLGPEPDGEGHFAKMMDAYKFAICYSLAKGVTPSELSGTRSNVFGVATIDPNKEIYSAINALVDTGDLPIYRWAERLADWGVNQISERIGKGDDLSTIISETTNDSL